MDGKALSEMHSSGLLYMRNWGQHLSSITMQKGSPRFQFCVKKHTVVIVVSIGAVAISALLPALDGNGKRFFDARGGQAAHYYTEEAAAAAEVRALHTHTEKAAWGKERRGSCSIRL
jgi:hypothetical protein